jgi:hypothetical protein
MNGVASSGWAYVRKLVSLALTFGCLLSILLVVGFLVGFYTAQWKLFEPFLLNANVLWLTIPVAVMDFFPIASFGHVKVRRLGFHHFVYGLAIVVVSFVLTPISVFNVFSLGIRDVKLNVGRTLILVGLTLTVDDFADISDRTRMALRFMKSRLHQKRRGIHAVHGLLSCITFYVFLCTTIWLTQNPKGINFANLALSTSLLVTSLTGFGSIGKRIWLRIKP